MLFWAQPHDFRGSRSGWIPTLWPDMAQKGHGTCCSSLALPAMRGTRPGIATLSWQRDGGKRGTGMGSAGASASPATLRAPTCDTPTVTPHPGGEVGGLAGSPQAAQSRKVAAMPNRPFGTPCPPKAQPCCTQVWGDVTPCGWGSQASRGGDTPRMGTRAPTWLWLRPGHPPVLPHIAAPQCCAWQSRLLTGFMAHSSPQHLLPPGSSAWHSPRGHRGPWQGVGAILMVGGKGCCTSPSHPQIPPPPCQHQVQGGSWSCCPSSQHLPPAP